MLRGVVEMIPAQQEKGCFTHVVYRVLAQRVCRKSKPS